jgi:polyhydroxyalkanoate synthesis regulator phasin
MAVKRKVVAAGVAALAVGGTGAGIAATKLASSPSAENKAIVDAAAKNLGVEPSKLSAAIKKALEDRVDAAVAEGRLTKEQGAELKQRIESGEFPLFAGPGFEHGFAPPHMFFHGLDSAATYLGLTEEQLHRRLESGKTLAEIAKAQNKSVDGLKAAMIKDVQAKLDQAVKDGRLSKAQEQHVLSDLQQRIDDLVNGKLQNHFPGRQGFGFRRGFGFGDRQGPPAFFDSAA